MDVLKELQSELDECCELQKLMEARREYEKTNLETRILDLYNRISHLETEHAQSISDDDGFNGYYYIDNDGNKCHTWDFEESIGE